jgi:hypothetical protein
MTKPELIDLVRSRRAEWDVCIAQVPQDKMTIPNSIGTWSIKDIIAHLTYYELWMANRLHERLRGEVYYPNEWDMMHWDARNALIYERDKNIPLEDVLRASKEAFQQLVDGIEANPESFLLEPQQFEGLPMPILVWDMIRSEVYDHYRQHIPSIQEWLIAHHT